MTDNNEGSTPQGSSPQGPTPQGPDPQEFNSQGQGPNGQPPFGGQHPDSQGRPGYPGGQGGPGQTYGGPQYGGPQFGGQQGPGPGQYRYGGPQNPNGFGPGGPGYGPGGQPPKKNNNALTIGLAVAAVVVLALFIGIGMVAKNLGETTGISGGTTSSESTPGSGADPSDESASPGATEASDFSVGDCLAEPVQSTYTSGPPEVVDCDSTDAELEVLSIRNSESATPCVDVAGAEGSIKLFGVGFTVMCVGNPELSPEDSINLISEGECMNVDSEPAVRVDCGESGAWKVVAVVQNPPAPEGEYVNAIPECEQAGHPEAEMIYTWAIPSNGETMSVDALVPDRGACLVTP